MNSQPPLTEDIQRAIELMDSAQGMLEKAVQEMGQARALLFSVRESNPLALPLCIRVMGAYNALMASRAEVMSANFRNREFKI